MKKQSFTLSEILIILGVIGIVATITLPTLTTNVSERKISERQVNVAQKVTQAMEQMRAKGTLVQYDSTESFVEELKKNLKITKICDKDHLAECWPSGYVTGKDGEQYSVSDSKTGKDIGLLTETNNVGILLADGTPIILNYDNTNPGLDVGNRVTSANISLPVGNNKTKNFPYTTSVTDSIDFIMDLNGKSGPNNEGGSSKLSDIRPFRAASITGCPGFIIPSLGCVINIGTNYAPVQSTYQAAIPHYPQTCTVARVVGGVMQPGTCYEDTTRPPSSYTYEPRSYYSYLAGAYSKCASINNMHVATSNDINAISQYIGKISGAPAYGDTFIVISGNMLLLLGEMPSYDTAQFISPGEIQSGSKKGDQPSNVLCVE